MVPNKWCQAPFSVQNGAWHHLLRPGTIYWGLAPFIPKASLSSPPERNHARSASLTVFSPYSLRHARERRRRASSMSERSELRRRREERMENGVRNLKGARLFSKTFSNHRSGDAYICIAKFNNIYYF